MKTKEKRTIRAIPAGGESWQIFIDGEFVSLWECETDSSSDAIEDFACNSGSINLDDFEIIEDI